MLKSFDRVERFINPMQCLLLLFYLLLFVVFRWLYQFLYYSTLEVDHQFQERTKYPRRRTCTHHHWVQGFCKIWRNKILSALCVCAHHSCFLVRTYQQCILSKTLNSYWSSLLHSFRTLKFLPICGGGCPFFGAGGGGWGGTRYAANSWDLDMMKMWFANWPNLSGTLLISCVQKHIGQSSRHGREGCCQFVHTYRENAAVEQSGSVKGSASTGPDGSQPLPAFSKTARWRKTQFRLPSTVYPSFPLLSLHTSLSLSLPTNTQ